MYGSLFATYSDAGMTHSIPYLYCLDLIVDGHACVTAEGQCGSMGPKDIKDR